MLTRNLLNAALALLCGLAASASLAQSSPPPGECPQPRFTGKAPDDYLSRTNPLAANPQSARAGEVLFLGTTDSETCAICHGRKGNGKGVLAGQFDPPPRNFACAQTVTGVPDGQLFWIIRFGSPGTSMPPHPKLTDEQVWQLIMHLRQLAK